MRGAAVGGLDPESTDLIERHRLWARLRRAVATAEDDQGPLPRPLMVVDLDAFDRNAADLADRAGGKPIRVASKSLRVPALLRRVLALPRFSGVLSFTLAEALWLEQQGISDDLVVGYPTTDRAALTRLLGSPSALAHVTVMVDSTEHLDLIEAVRAGMGDAAAEPVRVAIDIDAGLQITSGSPRIGPKRSPLFAVEDVVALARAVVERPGMRLVGVMTYEGQVAGVPDDTGQQRLRDAVIRRVKRLSLSQLRTRRAEIEHRLRDLAELEFWNAGGSGSVQDSAADPAVTEIAAGSGLLVPGLFDHYRSFVPRSAAYFGLPVSRRPGARMVTCHGGGLIASGPTGADRQPLPWAPPGLSLTAMEAAGEVQTPVTGEAADLLSIGDLVWFRHAKSGEVFEHTDRVHLLRGDRIVETVPTYRGHGLVF